MKSNVFFFLLALGTVLFSSGCAKDSDSCTAELCVNGFCSDGSCECYPGYSGSDCSQKLVPELIRINKIIVTKWPQLKGDETWDNVTDVEKRRPDPYVRVWHYENGDAVELYKSGRKLNPEYNSELTFTPSGGVRIENPTDSYRLSLYDADDSGETYEFMGGRTFDPWNVVKEGIAFPDFFEITTVDGDVTFRVEITYEH